MIKDLRDLITEKEMKAFEGRVDAYGSKEYGERTVSGHHLLRFWSDAKSQYLFKLFGGKDLILSKTITFERSEDQLRGEMASMVDKDEFINKYWYPFQRENWKKYINSMDDSKKSKSLQIHEAVMQLISTTTLINNVCDYPTTIIPTEDGKGIKIQNGCKPVKTIGKIAKKLDMDMDLFEQFRIKVSQVLNQKKLVGELCLSIHPLDYSTMSDNDYDWKSCMSWEDYGCYRQGTVEMMNSPMVIVAYLNGATPMDLGDGFQWSNKKWRELFIINKDLITNVKSYPYFHEELSQTALDWIKELADKNLSKEDGFCFDFKRVEYSPYDRTDVEHTYIQVRPDTYFMYNDFDNTYKNWAYFNCSYINTDYTIEAPEEQICFCYSGESECLGCGEACDFYENEGALFGNCCDAYCTCDWCGDNYASMDELVEVDGQYLCPDCMSNECEEDAVSGEFHIRSNMTEIHLLSKEEDDGKHYSNSIFVYDLEAVLNTGYFKNMRKYVYFNKCLGDIYFVTEEDCTEVGLKLFENNDGNSGILRFDELTPHTHTYSEGEDTYSFYWRSARQIFGELVNIFDPIGGMSQVGTVILPVITE